MGEVIFEKQKYAFITKDRVYEGVTFGVISMANFDTGEEFKPETFNTYVKKCKRVLLEKGLDSDYIFICSGGSFLQTRSAVIAAKEALPTAKVYSLMQFDKNKNSADSWSPLAQMLTLQALKCDGVIVDCPDKEALKEILCEILPHAKIPVAVWSDDFCDLDKELYGKVSAVLLKQQCDIDTARENALKTGFFDAKSEKYRAESDILAVSNGEAWFLDYDMDVSEPVICDEYFSESILDIEDEESFIIKIDISSEDELDIFETEQYMVKNPVCICSDDSEIFAKAVRMFSGIAVYDGTSEIDERMLAKLSDKYGLVIL